MIGSHPILSPFWNYYAVKRRERFPPKPSENRLQFVLFFNRVRQLISKAIHEIVVCLGVFRAGVGVGGGGGLLRDERSNRDSPPRLGADSGRGVPADTSRRSPI